MDATPQATTCCCCCHRNPLAHNDLRFRSLCPLLHRARDIPPLSCGALRRVTSRPLPGALRTLVPSARGGWPPGYFQDRPPDASPSRTGGWRRGAERPSAKREFARSARLGGWVWRYNARRAKRATDCERSELLMPCGGSASLRDRGWLGRAKRAGFRAVNQGAQRPHLASAASTPIARSARDPSERQRASTV